MGKNEYQKIDFFSFPGHPNMHHIIVVVVVLVMVMVGSMFSGVLFLGSQSRTSSLITAISECGPESRVQSAPE